MSTALAFRDQLIETLKAIVAARVVTICGDTYTMTRTVGADDVSIGTDPLEAGPDHISVHMGAHDSRNVSVRGTGAMGLGEYELEQELHLFASVSADQDGAEQKEDAGYSMRDHIFAAIADDRSQGVRVGSVKGGTLSIEVRSAVVDGGAEADYSATLYMVLVGRWTSYTGV